jgi:ATP-dependent DNA helicase RecQ
VNVVIDKKQMIETMERYFGFHTFRAGQEAVVSAILEKRDVFAVMPTGGGKSLCYQLPACLLPGTCMVVSPLIALMKDQVDAANASGIRAAFLNSSQSERERASVQKSLGDGQFDLLYVSPERFAQEQFRESLKAVPLNLVAIDEAHCICEWGHDFRPDYLFLSQLVYELSGVPIAAFTATATAAMQQDIIQRLGLRQPFVYRGSFDRPNLYYDVIGKENLETQILEYVRKHQNEAGIIYRTSRASVDSTTTFLNENGIRALPYHAGLDDFTREQNQEAFSHDRVDVMVATIAFGMGIDKSNVRYVLHGDLPKSMENYYQESGRAGRDGENAQCVLFFSRGDIPKLRFYVDKIENEQIRNLNSRSLEKMAAYATLQSCRRKSILAHFGENFTSDNCGTCDVCTSEQTTVDITTEAQMILSAVARTNQRFGAGHIVDIITGADTKQIRSFGHDKLKTWGVGKGKIKRQWLEIVDILKLKGILALSDGPYPLLKLTEDASEVLYKGKKVSMAKSVSETPKSRSAEETFYDTALFERLRIVRKKIAEEKGVPPFVVFSDKTLHEMSSCFPLDEKSMLLITGVGEVKLSRFGDQFIVVIKEYVNEFPDAPSKYVKQHIGSPVRHLAAQKSSPLTDTFLETHRLLSNGLTIEEAAAKRELTTGTIISHIEKLVLCGKIDSIDPFMESDRYAIIEKKFKELNTESLKEVVFATDGTVSYDEARLVRAWMKRNTERISLLPSAIA